MEYLDEYARWINEADPETVAELESIKDDDAEIKDRFYKTVSYTHLTLPTIRLV